MKNSIKKFKKYRIRRIIEQFKSIGWTLTFGDAECRDQCILAFRQVVYNHNIDDYDEVEILMFPEMGIYSCKLQSNDDAYGIDLPTHNLIHKLLKCYKHPKEYL